MSLLTLVVADVVEETNLIRRIAFAAPDAGALPGFDAGSHITLQVPAVGRRKYSLLCFDPAPGATAGPKRYMLGVRREDAGGGGSKWIHALKPGDRVEAEPPQNDFALHAGEGRVTLIAGGIGVTPLITMAAEMKAKGRPFRFVYAARSASEYAFVPAIRALAGDALTLHADDTAGGFLDLRGVFDTLMDNEPVYICGPKPMLKGAIQESRKRGWAAGRLRYELFYSIAPDAPPPPPKDDSFEIEIKSTGAVYTVPAGKTIVDVLVAAGLDPLHDCMKGECGVCQTGVLSGTPDHKDSILSESERAAGKIMQICISRSKSPRLVLDL